MPQESTEYIGGYAYDQNTGQWHAFMSTITPEAYAQYTNERNARMAELSEQEREQYNYHNDQMTSHSNQCRSYATQLMEHNSNVLNMTNYLHVLMISYPVTMCNCTDCLYNYDRFKFHLLQENEHYSKMVDIEYDFDEYNDEYEYDDKYSGYDE